MKNGKGTLITKDNEKYVGEWKDDLKHGNGKFRYSLGTLTYPNNDVYEGEWVNNLRNGQGKYAS